MAALQGDRRQAGRVAYKVLYLPVWMGDDYQVIAQHLLQTQLEEAGATFTTSSAEFDVPTQTRLMEDAIATHAYDAIVLHPIDPTSMATTIDKAIASGIDVYNWVLPANTDKLTGFAGYDADTMEGNGQIGVKFSNSPKRRALPPRSLIACWRSGAHAPCRSARPVTTASVWGWREIPPSRSSNLSTRPASRSR